MNPATWPRDDVLAERLVLCVDDEVSSALLADLPSALRPGDLLVLNDAATLPASLGGTVDGAPIELRLAEAPDADGSARAVLFGRGDWRTPTEHRAAPPLVRVGVVLRFDGREGASDAARPDAAALSATITRVSALSPRLVVVHFDRHGDALLAALYRLGRPVQYSYVAGPLPLWAVQTPFSGAPLAVEMPSASRPLPFRLIASLSVRGVAIASLTHGAGLSSTGDAAIDVVLPLDERGVLPAATVDAIRATRARRGRVIAAGTSVARALEGVAAKHDSLRPGPYRTDLRLARSSPRRVVDGLLTGLHRPPEPHWELLRAFTDDDTLARLAAAAEPLLAHEFGDSALLIAA